MAFKYTKKISSTTPYTDAMGQYNYDNTGQKVGVLGNRQLYSLSSNSDENINFKTPKIRLVELRNT